jgi:N-acetylglucosaminyldiphosphoundecaprenol N-acetyl-beta-D-mannosaminyltransferase
MLFLGITTPKKEIFLGRHGHLLGVPVLHGVGGSFDVFAGVTRRAPLLWQRLGLEWAYRLVQEPRRLWRRYLVTNVTFLGLLARELVKPRPAFTRPAADAVRADHREDISWTHTSTDALP